MRKAGSKDKNIVVNILTVSFINDPHLNWILEQSKNRNKLKYTMEYIFEETLRKGEIYLSDDNTATALWNSEKEEKFSFHLILRDLSFLFRIGIKTIIRIMTTEKLTHNQYPKNEEYYHLYLIGVLPEVQGKGLASSLMNPIIENMNIKSIPIYLETANPKNVEIYKKKGFIVFYTMQCGNTSLYFMRK